MNKNMIEKDDSYIPLLLKEIAEGQLKSRLEHELYTYAKRAVFYKKAYYCLTFATIICPASVVVVNVFSDNSFSFVKLIVSIISAISAIAAGILGAANVRDNWLNYRSNCEKLKAEVFKYISCAGIYNVKEEKERTEIFTNEILRLYSEESKCWTEYNFNKK